MKLSKKRFLDLIARTGLKVADIAAAIGCTDGHLCNVIAGRRKLNIKLSRRLLEMFGADRMQFAIDWDAMGIKDPLKEAR